MVLRWLPAWAAGLLAMAAVPLTPAAAAEWDSHAAFKFQSRSVALPDGRNVTTFTNNGAYQNVWADRTTAGTLACTGMIERASDGVSLEAYCEHVDGDGDRYYQHSIRTKSDSAGGGRGREEGLGGTGKHEGRRWSCDYQVTYVSESWGVVHAQCTGDPPKS